MRSAALLLVLVALGCKKEAPPPAAPPPAAPPAAKAPTGPAALLAADVWVCDGGADKSWITKSTTRAQLEELVGADALVDEEQNFMESEETFVVTTLYPNDPKRRATINWTDDDPTKGVDRLVLLGDRWRMTNGLRPGLSLEDAEKIHGGAFTLMGFEWDMGGMSTVKDTGVTWTVPEANTQRPAYEKVMGDGEFSSDDPSMRAVEPVVHVVHCTPKA